MGGQLCLSVCLAGWLRLANLKRSQQYFNPNGRRPRPLDCESKSAPRNPIALQTGGGLAVFSSSSPSSSSLLLLVVTTGATQIFRWRPLAAAAAMAATPATAVGPPTAPKVNSSCCSGARNAQLTIKIDPKWRKWRLDVTCTTFDFHLQPSAAAAALVFRRKWPAKHTAATGGPGL